ncbi:MAG: DUF4340 domain-containing protein [Polyangiaceae bacterium]
MPLPAILRRHGVSIALTAAAASLGAYLYVVDSSHVTTRELEARKRNLFRVWRRGEIERINLESSGEIVKIRRRADDAGDVMYDLENGEAADQVSVDKLLAVLEFVTPERKVEAGVDRAAMGLAKPRAELELFMGRTVKDAIQYRLKIGGPAPSPPGSSYAELDGSRVEGGGLFVVSRDFVTEMTRSVDVYRGRTLVPYLSSNLAELALEGEGGNRRFVHGAPGWTIVRENSNIRVDRDTFDRMLTSLAGVRAETFVAEADAERIIAETPSKVRIVMTPRDKSLPRAVIDVGGDCPGHPDDIVAVHREPLPKKAACVPQGSFDGLAQPFDRFVDLHLFSLRPDEMEEVLLQNGKDRLEIVRAGMGFHQRAPTEGNVETDVGQAFTKSLSDLTAKVVSGAPNDEGLEMARTPNGKSWSATITRVDGGEERAGAETVEGGAGCDKYCLVRRLADGAVLSVTYDVHAALQPSGLALRSRKVIDETASHVRRIAIEGASVHQVIARSNSGGFTLEEPKSLAVDPALASDVTEALVKLRAERWVSPHDAGGLGQISDRVHYDLDLESGHVRIDIGSATSGGVFAKLADQPDLFILSDAARRNIETWAVDRSYFMIDPNEVKRIEFKRGATKWDLSTASRDAGASIERFEIARKVLAEARTEGAVHLGPPQKDEGFDKPRLELVVHAVPAPPAKPREIRITVGRGDVYRDNNVYFIRRAGVDATFAIAQSKLRPLLEMN